MKRGENPFGNENATTGENVVEEIKELEVQFR